MRLNLDNTDLDAVERLALDACIAVGIGRIVIPHPREVSAADSRDAVLHSIAGEIDQRHLQHVHLFAEHARVTIGIFGVVICDPAPPLTTFCMRAVLNVSLGEPHADGSRRFARDARIAVAVSRVVVLYPVQPRLARVGLILHVDVLFRFCARRGGCR